MKTLILHGWSDEAASFEKLARFLREDLGREVEHLYLGDWISLDDDVTFRDLAEGMERAWRVIGLPRDPRSVDVVVHSTGSLVTREWMTRFYRPETCPIYRLLMLAPANFGSPLAHKGRTWLGRLFKGRRSGFETGRHLLQGLELGSPYLWALAERDLPVSGEAIHDPWYGRGRILCTCLVGGSPYQGVKAAFSEVGSDGTVRIAGANPNAVRVRLDYTKGDSGVPAITRWEPPEGGEGMAFALLVEENHETLIFHPDGSPRNDETRDLVSRALEQTDDGWEDWWYEMRAHYRNARHAQASGDAYYRGYQDTLVRVRDQYGSLVEDYLMEFTLDDRDSWAFARHFHHDVLRKVHVHGNTAYRSFYIDVDALGVIDREGEALKIGLTASPTFSGPDENPPVGYRPMTVSDHAPALVIPWNTITDYFQPDRTLFLDIVLEREIAERVFRIRHPV